MGVHIIAGHSLALTNLQRARQLFGRCARQGDACGFVIFFPAAFPAAGKNPAAHIRAKTKAAGAPVKPSPVIGHSLVLPALSNARTAM